MELIEGMADLSIQTQGVKGGNTQSKKAGYMLACFEDESQRISIDNFEGRGETYKEREAPLIEVIDNGATIFSGTFAELKAKLNA